MVTSKNPNIEVRKENIAEILEDPQRACKLNNKLFKKNSKIRMDKYVLGYIGQSSIIGVEDVIRIEDIDEFSQYQCRV